ncbi:Uu.00g111280.m01.CDS01 [Anthostomella pinea]|uniref:Uu.00g111280.m01.CDS01 n=1 Tax=Anthostomella pinea TaxID=933095 RepID=A0AAI8YG93_9PEZI|nr:Uu.00g111280.m01.CDS01 [Anthostomella pinea]
MQLTDDWLPSRRMAESGTGVSAGTATTRQGTMANVKKHVNGNLDVSEASNVNWIEVASIRKVTWKGGDDPPQPPRARYPRPAQALALQINAPEAMHAPKPSGPLDAILTAIWHYPTFQSIGDDREVVEIFVQARQTYNQSGTDADEGDDKDTGGQSPDAILEYHLKHAEKPDWSWVDENSPSCRMHGKLEVATVALADRDPASAVARSPRGLYYLLVNPVAILLSQLELEGEERDLCVGFLDDATMSVS